MVLHIHAWYDDLHERCINYNGYMWSKVMKNRFDFFPKPKEKPKPKTAADNFKEFVKKIEKDDIEIIKCEIPGKNDGDFRYMRPWKL